MFCSIYKWSISKALDSEKPYSLRVQHHLAGCSSCREFMNFSELLQKKTAAAKPDLSQGYASTLPQRIMASLDTVPEPRSKRGIYQYLVPVATSAVMILAVSVSVLFLTSPRNNSWEPLDELLRLNQAQARLEETLNRLDSPLETEYKNLKFVVESTADYLISRFDIKLGPEQNK